MTDESPLDVGKIRGNRILLPIAILAPLSLALIAWGTNANRLATLEQEQAEGKAERERMELHINADDQQIAVLKERLTVIIEQLGVVNAKLDRAEEERHK